MLNPVDEYHCLILENLIHDPIVAPAGRPKALQLPDQRMAKSVGVVGDRAEYRQQRGVSDFVREPIEMAETFGSDLDLIHEGRSDLIAQLEPFSLDRFPLRAPN